MNRAERRLLSRARKRWLAAVAADRSTTHEELLVATWIAENADNDGHVELDYDRMAEEI